MKKLFLLLAVGAGFTASAQKAESAPGSNRVQRSDFHGVKRPHAEAPAGYVSPFNTANKSADGTTGDWFCFSDAIFTQGTSELTYWYVYPDSTVQIQGTNTFNWYLHGMGTSLDPKSEKFGTQFSNATPYFPQPSFGITSGNAYLVDSVGIYGWYDRFDATVNDTLDIYVVNTPSTGAFNITWTYTGDVAPYWGRTDSKLQVAMAIYDWQKNAFSPDSVASVRKFTKILDDAAFADSTFFAPDNTYLHIWNFGLSPALNVTAGGNVVAYVVFRKAFAYPFNTNITTVNKWNQLTEAVGGANGIPNQIIGDFNGGLGAFSEERYHFGDYYALTGDRAVLAPTYAYTPIWMSDPWFSFYLRCPDCDLLSVNNVGSKVSDVKVYPNPTVDKINISFTAEQKGVATVAITNSVGQMVAFQKLNVNGASVASFATNTLANGTYFYTVEVNGQKTSASFVVNR